MAQNVGIPSSWKLPLREQLARGYDGNLMTQQFDSLEKYLEMIRPMFFHSQVIFDNGTSLPYTVFADTGILMYAPHDCSMLVTGAGQQGFSAGANVAQYQITAQDNGNITLLPGNATVNTNPAGSWTAWSFPIGIKHYAKGEPIGWKLWYLVNTSNLYLRGSVITQIFPRRRSAVTPY